MSEGRGLVAALLDEGGPACITPSIAMIRDNALLRT